MNEKEFDLSKKMFFVKERPKWGLIAKHLDIKEFIKILQKEGSRMNGWLKIEFIELKAGEKFK